MGKKKFLIFDNKPVVKGSMYGLIPFTATDPPEEKRICFISKTSTKRHYY